MDKLMKGWLGWVVGALLILCGTVADVRIRPMESAVVALPGIPAGAR